MSRFININGRLLPAPQATLPHDNRSFRYGAGLFETMLVRNGQIRLAGYHWERLLDGVERLQLRLPRLWSPAYLQQAVLRTVEKNGPEPLARVRLQLWDGQGGLFETGAAAGFIIEVFPLDESVLQLNENGLVVGIAQGLCKSADSLSGLKSANALLYAQAARQAQHHRWNDALIRNTHGHIIESTIANTFWMEDGRLFTPPLSGGCVAGVMRRHLLTVLPTLQLPVATETLTPERLAAADEVLLTNSVRGLRWIGSFSEHRYTQRISATISRRLAETLL